MDTATSLSLTMDCWRALIMRCVLCWRRRAIAEIAAPISAEAMAAASQAAAPAPLTGSAAATLLQSLLCGSIRASA